MLYGCDIYISDINPEKVHVLGTLGELKVFVDGEEETL
jgi:hypothetical protein